VSKLTEPEDVKRLAKVTRKANLEQKFLEAWNRKFPHLPKPIMQHKFNALRKWRFDFAWEFVGGLAAVRTVNLAVEIDGGAYVGGGHTRGKQQSKDYEKMNVATAMGWRVLRFNTESMKYPDDVVEFVAQVLTNAKDAA
jgi:very-short-patch-repair endonuclease